MLLCERLWCRIAGVCQVNSEEEVPSNSDTASPLRSFGGSRTEAPYPGRGYAWYVVGVLTAAYVLSFIDRQILNLLVPAIKADLALSDTQISLLQGIAFALFYTIMGIPIGRLADRSSRRMIIAVGVFTWGLMTAMCGLTRQFATLFAARMGVGVGEATLSPAAYSLIADYFPPDNVNRAISIYTGGSALGAGLAYIIGGSVIDLVSELGTLTLPLVGTLKPWQAAFVLVGIPGPILAVIMLSVREPVRRGVLPNPVTGRVQSVPIKEALAFLVRHRETYGAHFAGFSVIIMLAYALLAWTPTFFIRTYGWTPGEIGVAYGSIILVFFTAGIVGGGFMADVLRRKGNPDANIRIVMIGSLAFVPFGVLAPLMPEAWLALLLVAPTSFFIGLPHGLGPAALQPITPNQLRAQVSALYLFTINLVGMGLGPLSVALVTDYVFGDPSYIHYSLASVSALVAPISALLLWRALKPYKRTFAEAEQGWMRS